MKILKPDSLDEAQRNISDGAIPFGGGTVLSQAIQRGDETRDVVDLSNLYELKQLTIDGDVMRIGALTTIEQIARHAKIRKLLPALSQAAASIGSPQSRRLGTVGGNISLYANGDLPTADLIPALQIFDASVYYTEFDKPKKIDELTTSEIWLIERIDIPLTRNCSAFWKFGNRENGGSSLAVINCAVAEHKAATNRKYDLYTSIGGLSGEVLNCHLQIHGEIKNYDFAQMKRLLTQIWRRSDVSEYHKSLACWGVWNCMREVSNA